MGPAVWLRIWLKMTNPKVAMKSRTREIFSAKNESEPVLLKNGERQRRSDKVLMPDELYDTLPTLL